MPSIFDALVLRWLKRKPKPEPHVPVKPKRYRISVLPLDGVLARNYYQAVKDADRANRAKFPNRRNRMKAKAQKNY